MNDPISKPVPIELEGIHKFSKLLDAQFRIPGTKIRFGFDFLLGLIPYAGDTASFLLSAGLVMTMVRHGASGNVLGKMIFNIVLDTLVGSIPLLGDIFDLYYKANQRNYQLLEEHYGEGEHQGSIWPIILAVLFVFIALLALMFWINWKLIGWFLGILF